MRRWSAGAAGVLLALSLAGCSFGKASKASSASGSPSTHGSTPSGSAAPASPGPSSSGSSSGAPSGSSTVKVPGAGAAASRAGGCVYAQRGTCRGALKAGTYRTVAFSPQIGFTLPAGWSNVEDTQGDFLLIPPGGSLAGVDPGTSDYVGVYSGVAAGSSDCTTPAAAPEVGTTPAKIAAHWTNLSTVSASKPRPVTVGGLHGLVLDLTPDLATKACPQPSSGYGYQPLLFGVGPASLNHGLIKGLHLRVYLLTELDGSTLAIELDDVHGGASIPAYAKVAEALKFGKQP